MLSIIFASLLLTFSAAEIDPKIESNKKWHLLDSKGECGHSPIFQTSPGQVADNGISSRLFGNNDALKHEFPWIAQLIHKPTNKSAPICGGSLISKHYVLTAAHCVLNPNDGRRLPANEFQVRLGAHSVVNFCVNCRGIQQYDIEQITVHNNYNATSNENDIALVRLKRNARFISGKVAPVCLPVELGMDKMNFDGKWMTVAGFGRIERPQSEDWIGPTELRKASEVLQKLSLKGSSNCCFDSETQICTESVNEGSHAGDSGGPLMYRHKNIYYQTGLMSFGDLADTVVAIRQFSVYTKVAHYMDWILNEIH